MDEDEAVLAHVLDGLTTVDGDARREPIFVVFVMDLQLKAPTQRRNFAHVPREPELGDPLRVGDAAVPHDGVDHHIGSGVDRDVHTQPPIG